MIKGLARILLIASLTSLAACGGGGGSSGDFLGSGEGTGTGGTTTGGTAGGTTTGGGSTGGGTTGGDGETAQVIGSIELTVGASEVVASGDENDPVAVTAVVKDTGGTAIVGQEVTFKTTAGTFADAATPTTTTATTGTGGIARVMLVSSTNAGALTVYANAGGYITSEPLAFVAGAPANVMLFATPTAVAPGESVSISVAVSDAYDNRINDTKVSLRLYDDADGDGVIDAGEAILNSLEDYTDEYGVLSTSLNAHYDIGKRVLQAEVVNGKSASTPISVEDAAIVVGNVDLSVSQSTITADGSSTTEIRAWVEDTDGIGINGATVKFATTAGTLKAYDGTETDEAVTVNGLAKLRLAAPTKAGSATVSVAYGGFNPTAQVIFAPGDPDSEKSTLTSSPNTVAKEGSTTITVVLIDAYGNLVPGKTVTLLATDGTVDPVSQETTSSGRAIFSFLAPDANGTVDLSLNEYPDITGTVSVGSVSTGEPANINLTVADQELFVSGVGQVSGTSMSVIVTDSAGNRIADAAEGVNNLKLSFVTRPNGGEYLSGADANGDVVTTTAANPSISVRTKDGEAAIGMQAGTLPGAVEIQIEALDSNGASLDPPVLAVAPQISIASGPAHTIAVTWPKRDAIEDLGGIYKRIGRATVTDRYGNPVPNGTTINLGVTDSVIVWGSDGKTTNNNSQLNSAAPQLTDNTPVWLDTARITRNFTSRGVQHNDRLLILDAQAEDKSRFVSTAINSVGNTSVDVQNDYANSATGLVYVIGAALLGGDVIGVNAASGEETRGTATTDGGTITFYLLYPADEQRILTGCSMEVPDDRNPPDDSGDVFVVASASDDSATTISTSGCFASMAPWEVSGHDLSGSAGSYGIDVQLTDNSTEGQGLYLPGQWVNAVVASISRAETSDFSVSVTGCITGTGVLNPIGRCTARVTITGFAHESGDSATLQFWSGDSEVAEYTVTAN